MLVINLLFLSSKLTLQYILCENRWHSFKLCPYKVSVMLSVLSRGHWKYMEVGGGRQCVCEDISWSSAPASHPEGKITQYFCSFGLTITFLLEPLTTETRALRTFCLPKSSLAYTGTWISSAGSLLGRAFPPNLHSLCRYPCSPPAPIEFPLALQAQPLVSDIWPSLLSRGGLLIAQ